MSTPATEQAPVALVVRTRAIADPGDLTHLLPRSRDAVAWLHGSNGFVGWGRAASFTAGGPDRFRAAQEWWDEIVAGAVVRDEVGGQGAGLVAFGSFTFDGLAGSTLVVPEIVVGRRDGAAWLTTIGTSIGTDAEVRPSTPTDPHGIEFADEDEDRRLWTETVAGAISRIQAGEVDKVVLARTVTAHVDQPLDVRAPLARLTQDYPGCWTFLVDGFFGSTPEMLVRLDGGLVTSRVLAGTIRRTGDDERDVALAGTLAHSSKDLEEHEYAVRSVADALAGHCTGMNVPEAPFVLHLPNVMHLATDVTGVLRDGTGAIMLADSLHPSAAVGGTPTREAVEMIAEIEDFERHRYAGPVGWVGASGDGEWGIGLRSAQVSDDGRQIQLFAGCGIVQDSVPADELAESDAKLIPIRHALTGHSHSPALTAKKE